MIVAYSDGAFFECIGITLRKVKQTGARIQKVIARKGKTTRDKTRRAGITNRKTINKYRSFHELRDC